MNLLERWVEHQKTHGKGGRGVSERRIKKYNSIYRGMEKLGHAPVPEILSSKEKTEELVGKINRSKYEAWTKSDYKVLLKQLWKLQNGFEQSERPKEIEWIKTGVLSNEKKLPANLITPGEMKKMLDAAKNARDKALLVLLYECGLRVSEVALLKKSDLAFVDKGVRLSVSEKTKTGARQILAVDSQPYLSAWLAQHPTKGGDYVFVAEHWVRNPKPGRKHIREYGRITEAGIAKILRQIKEAAGIEKRIHPHLFRHTAATRLAKYLSEQELKTYLGWTPNSNMAAVYVHLSGKDVDDSLLRMHGLTAPKKTEENKLSPIFCERCNRKNAGDAERCDKCGLPFDKEKALRDEIATQERIAKLEKENLEQNKKIKGLLEAELERRKAERGKG